jgi:chaperone LolA
MKKALFIITILLLSFSLSAQSAQDILNAVIEKNKAYKDISISFEYEFIDKTNDFSEMTGGYMYLKGDSFIINMDGQEMISNGETLWTYLIDDQEVMISEVGEDNNTTPFAIINSFSQNVNVNFNISENNNTSLLIEEKEKTTFENVIINIDNDLKINDISINTIDGSLITYKIKSFKTNQDLPDSMFFFDEKIHPNVEVIDMR